jgi:hypothetical protein
MANLAVVFLTGLTTGGLSCLAVQGGLLASSVAHQAEKDAQKALGARTPVPNRSRIQRSMQRKIANVLALSSSLRQSSNGQSDSLHGRLHCS